MVDGSLLAVGVCKGAAWAMACFMKRCAAALSISVRSKMVVCWMCLAEDGRGNALVGGFSAAESF